MTDVTVEYPNLATAPMKELVAFYNEHSGLEPIRKFKDKEAAQVACQQVIAQLEGTSDEEMEEEQAEVHADALSASAQLLAAAAAGGKKTSEKNEGVWLNVKRLLIAGKTNKEILAEIHELYGNSNTSYACIAWYRNKFNKLASGSLSREEQLMNFAKMHNISPEALAELMLIK